MYDIDKIVFRKITILESNPKRVCSLVTLGYIQCCVVTIIYLSQTLGKSLLMLKVNRSGKK